MDESIGVKLVLTNMEKVLSSSNENRQQNQNKSPFHIKEEVDQVIIKEEVKEETMDIKEEVFIEEGVNEEPLNIKEEMIEEHQHEENEDVELEDSLRFTSQSKNLNKRKYETFSPDIDISHKHFKGTIEEIYPITFEEFIAEKRRIFDPPGSCVSPEVHHSTTPSDTREEYRQAMEPKYPEEIRWIFTDKDLGPESSVIPNKLTTRMQTTNGELGISEQTESLEKQMRNNKKQIETIYEEVRELNQSQKEVSKSQMECEVCKKQFTQTGTLNRHIKIKHGGPLRKIEHCKECTYNTGRPHDLKRHTEAVHQDFLHKCGKCHKTFKWKKMLKKHEASHEDASP